MILAAKIMLFTLGVVVLAFVMDNAVRERSTRSQHVVLGLFAALGLFISGALA